MLLTSIGVFGPGDNIPVFKDSSAGSDIPRSLDPGGNAEGGGALSRYSRAPELQVKNYVLNFNIVCGRDFIPQNGLFGIILEPFVKVYHAGIEEKTAIVRNNPNPEWQSTIFLPCITPTFVSFSSCAKRYICDAMQLHSMKLHESKTTYAIQDELVTLEVWNGETNGVLLHYESIELRHLFNNAYQPHWINIYCQQSPYDILNLVKNLVVTSQECLTDYGGRILISASAVQVQAAPTKGIKPCRSVIQPPIRKKILWCDIYEIVPLTESPPTIDLVVSIGPHSIKTRPLKISNHRTYQINNENGRLAPLEIVVSSLFSNPMASFAGASDDDLWDIFIYLYEVNDWGGSERMRYAWKRIPFERVNKQGLKPMWCLLSSCSNFGQDLFNVLMTFQLQNNDEGVRNKRIEYTLNRYIFRAMIYEALHLPCLDFNNFPNSSVEIELAGYFIKSSTAKTSLHPSFYESKEIQVLLPSNLLLAPDVTISIFSEPQLIFTNRELLCTGQYSLSKIPKEWTKAPTWVQLKSQKNVLHRPFVLVAFELIPLVEYKNDPERYPFFDDIRPSTIPSLISLLLIGIRLFRPISTPRIVIQIGVNESKKRFKVGKPTSGSAGNYNFLTTHEILVDLPKRMQHHSFLEFLIYDDQECVGITYLTLNPLLPWLTPEERSASRDLFRIQVLEDFLATGEVAGNVEKPEAFLKPAAQPAVQDDIDSMNVKVYEAFDFVSLKRAGESPERMGSISENGNDLMNSDGMDKSLNFEITIHDDEPDVLQREEIPYEMECDFSTEDLPYMKAPIVQCTSAGVPEIVGMLKFMCIIEKHTEHSQRQEAALKMAERRDKLVDLYSKAKDLVVRFYALQAKGLCTGSGAANPSTYLWVRNVETEGTTIGSYPQNIKDTNVRNQGLKPIFNSCFNVGCALPENAILKVSVMNLGTIVDEVIGTTFIDCEDRYFNAKVQKLMADDAIPIELRTLKTESSTISHGTLRCWIEMMDVVTAKTRPIRTIGGLEPSDYELRLVVWRVKNVALEGTSSISLYVRGIFQTDEQQEVIKDTDIHYNSKDGNATFNWRFKYPIRIPSEYSQLKLQLFSYSLLSSSELIGEGVVDLSLDFNRVKRHRGHYNIPKFWVDCIHAAQGTLVRGSIEIEASLVTDSDAQTFPVGNGQEAPNKDPYLPPVLENRTLIDWEEVKNTFDNAGGAILSGLRWTGMFIAFAAAFALLLLVLVLIK
ncbi:bifunctional C2 domain superfamily/C2 domain/Ferlin family [Babesia duncani]|uniref:Bifunctional C2 domain superfamily/C2 domain/Ferlin family n=1 Tax=Babesia duncani TaxID=323732 RepID=A0AAD9PJ92_9APIC|nr:bifunctional C2 domain superfamily/C2 domain/Ferlin family [Babesia duncani]